MHDSLAQSVEHLPFKEVVDGSNPSRVTIVLFYQTLMRPHRLVVRTPPSQGGNGGSSPPGVANSFIFININ